MIIFAVAAALAVKDCSLEPTALLRDQCNLSQSLALDAVDHFDCEKRETQSDMNVCSYRDYLRLDIELNKTWNIIIERYKGSNIHEAVLESQRAWLKYRDKQCDIWSKYYEGGTIEALVENTCRSGITKFRISELKQLLENN